RLITGIGPTETAFSLTAALCRRHAGQIRAVLNFGIAGAYPDSAAGLLDICLAEREVLGDLGLWLPERIERFAERGLAVRDSFTLDADLCQIVMHALRLSGIACTTGTFVTVSCASGTEVRARLLGRQFQALCENMEGAAAARVCEAFGVPFVELRCVSNIAGERDRRKWRLQEASSRAGQAATLLLREGGLFSRF
ncbi:futalosine hydrolase, partial [Desulfobulbus sp. F3]|nr:futalosine hydrolase [Desulfobulbus sp. F3]